MRNKERGHKNRMYVVNLPRRARPREGIFNLQPSLCTLRVSFNKAETPRVAQGERVELKKH